MIEKLENTYLAILRFVVIAVAGILLVAAVILGLNSLKAIQFKPEIKKTLKVSEQELIKGIAEKPTKPQSKHPDDAADVNKTDLNIAFYERASNAIVNFVAKYSGGAEIVAKEQVVAIIQERAESLNDPILVTAFAKGFAESIEKTLADPSIIKIAQTTSTVDVINKAFNVFTQKFNEKIMEENKRFRAKQEEYIIKKSEGIQSLYIAACSFAGFLIIAFLSIIIRIERSLRHLENRPVNTA